MSSKKKQQQATKNIAALNQAEAVDLNFSLNALSSAGVEIQATLGQISQNLIAKHSELQAVDQTITIKKEEMASLHGVDAVLLSIDEIKATHVETVKTINQEREDLKKANTELEQQLEAQRIRENAEFVYALNLKRKVDNDAWQEQMRVRAASERDRSEAFEKDLKIRLTALQDTEKAYTTALATIATFDEQVRKAAEKEKAIAVNSLQKDFTHQNQLTEVKHTSEIMRTAVEIQAKDALIASQQRQIAELQTQLKAAIEAQVSLAKATVDGATNKQAQADALALVTSVGGGGNGKSPARS